MIRRRKFTKGVRLKPTDEVLVDEGDISVGETEKKLKVKADGADRNVVTEDQEQPLDNKTINTPIIDGTVSGTAIETDVSNNTSNKVPSASAVKTYVDAQVASKDEASELTYDPASNPETSAVNVQDALDDTGIASQAAQDAADAAQADATQALADAASAQSDVDDHIAATSGVHGVTGDVVGTTDTQTLTNKTIQGTSIESPSRLDVKKDTEANLITYAATASEGQFVYATDTQKMYQIIDSELAAVGGGGSTQFEINQVAHGFAVGDGIYHNGTSWVKGQSNDANTLAYQTVVAVDDVDNFTAADFGRIEATSHGFTVGEYYFLSDSVAGQPTITEPTSGFSNPLFYVESANILQIKCLRPTGTDAIELDQLADVSVPTPTDGQVLTYNTSNSRWESADSAADAADLTYTPSTLADWDSDVDPGNVDGALDQLAERVDDNEINITSNDTDIRELQTKVEYNYIANPDAEVDTTGWTVYANTTAGTSPDDFGGTPTGNLTWTRSTSTPLVGAASFLLSKTAANLQGEGVYYEFTGENGHLSMKHLFNALTDTSLLDDGDVRIYLVSSSDSFVADFNVISANNPEVLAGIPQIFKQFQFDAADTDYRLCIHYASTDAVAKTAKFDNFVFGPRAVATGTTVTDVTETTAIITGSGSNPTKASDAVEKYTYYRVGDTMHVHYSYRHTSTTGANSGSGRYDWNVPENLSIDTSKMNVGLFPSSSIGKGALVVGSNNYFVDVQAFTTTSITLRILPDGTGTLDQLDEAHGFAQSSTYRLSFSASFPIQGWSSNAVSSEDLGGREISAKYRKGSGSLPDNSTTIIDFDDKVRDLTNSATTGASWRYDVPQSGRYKVFAKIALGDFTSWDLSENARLSIYKNGVFETELDREEAKTSDSTASGTRITLRGGDTLDLVVGDYIDIRAYQNTGSSVIFVGSEAYNYVTIDKLASPQTILETETVAARYLSSNEQSTTSNDFAFEEIDYDTHNAYNTSTGYYTVPASGLYDIDATVRSVYTASSDNNVVGIRIYVNDVLKKETSSVAGSTGPIERTTSISDKLMLNKGDRINIEISSSVTSTASATSTDNVLSIARIK